jgi:hypothetical protein
VSRTICAIKPHTAHVQTLPNPVLQLSTPPAGDPQSTQISVARKKKKKKKKKTQIFFKPKMSLSAGRKAAAASAPKLPALLARLRAYPDDPVLPLKQKDASGARVPVREVLSRCAAEAKLKPAEIAAEMEAARGLMESRWLHTVRDGGDGIDPRIHSELQ